MGRRWRSQHDGTAMRIWEMALIKSFGIYHVMLETLSIMRPERHLHLHK